MPPPVPAPASVRVVPQPPLVELTIWHYSATGVRRGPVTLTQLKALAAGGALRPNDMVWCEGMPGWIEAATLPDLFPPGVLVQPPPMPAPVPVPAPPPPEPDDYDNRRRRRDRDDRDDDDDRRSRRGNRDRDRDDRPIQVHVHTTDRDEDDRGSRRREGFRCPYCGSTARPIVRQQVSGAGWAVFVVLLLCTIIFCFVGLLMKEDVRVCRDCGAKL